LFLLSITLQKNSFVDREKKRITRKPHLRPEPLDLPLQVLELVLVLLLQPVQLGLRELDSLEISVIRY
jgi:hypothetical protein